MHKIDERYREAIHQVKVVTDHLNEKLYAQLPRDLIGYIIDEGGFRSRYYWKYDFSKDFWQQDYLPEARKILSLIVYLYLDEKITGRYSPQACRKKYMELCRLSQLPHYHDKKHTTAQLQKYRTIFLTGNSSNKTSQRKILKEKFIKYHKMIEHRFQEKNLRENASVKKKRYAEMLRLDILQPQEAASAYTKKAEKYKRMEHRSSASEISIPQTLLYLRKALYERSQKNAEP